MILAMLGIVTATVCWWEAHGFKAPMEQQFALAAGAVFMVGGVAAWFLQPWAKAQDRDDHLSFALSLASAGLLLVLSGRGYSWGKPVDALFVLAPLMLYLAWKPEGSAEVDTPPSTAPHIPPAARGHEGRMLGLVLTLLVFGLLRPARRSGGK
jgi:hypothetical protein